MHIDNYTGEFNEKGFVCIEDIYSSFEVEQLIKVIENTDQSKPTFRKSKDLFAVRQFLKEVPQITEFIFNDRIKTLISCMFGLDYFVSKSIYFDKPGKSNWFVAYHQDLTISVTNKVASPGYGPWMAKYKQFAVQPPVSILSKNFTIRIHLDDTDAANGALRVLQGSQKLGVQKNKDACSADSDEVICNVGKGGIMLMHPLLFHASDRTVNGNQRRVIHLEFSNSQLPEGLCWSELMYFN